MLNNNFNELVKKYEKYKSKKRDKRLLSILLILSILIGGYYLVTNSSFITQSFKKTTPEPQESETIVDTQIADEPTENEPEQETKTVKEEKAEKPLQRVKVDTPKTEELPNKVYERSAKKIEETNPFQLEVKERKNLYKLLTDDKKQNSYQSAISVAQFYFDEKNYDQTIIWSVKASKRDPRESLPWILYAKSKATQGKTKVAKKALSIYLKHTDSKEVQNLLDTLK